MLARSLTALIAAPLLVALIRFTGPGIFFILALLACLVALREFYAMALPRAANAELGSGLLLGAILPAAGFFAAPAYDPVLAVLGMSIVAFMLLFAGYICFDRSRGVPFDRIVILFIGIFYIALLFSFVILLRGLPHGIALVFFLLFVTWAGDIGAYLTGKTMGKHLLCPRVSPAKTIEGSCGGALLGIAAAVVCQTMFLKHISLPHCLVMAAGINILNQFGDLSESAIKRFCGVKDSGSILPGHGGILDRVDSLLFAAPFLYYYIRLLDC